jgi:hypothetical protein
MQHLTPKQSKLNKQLPSKISRQKLSPAASGRMPLQTGYVKSHCQMQQPTVANTLKIA